MQECQVHRMKYLICEFRDTLLTLVVALCSGVSVPLAPASKTGQAHKQSIKPYIERVADCNVPQAAAGHFDKTGYTNHDTLQKQLYLLFL